MADSYVKTIDLKFNLDTDKDSSKDVEKLLDDLQDKAKHVKIFNDDELRNQLVSIRKQFEDLDIVKSGFLSEEEQDKMFDQYEKQMLQLAEIEKLKQEISELEMFSGESDNIKTLKAELKDLEENQDKNQVKYDSKGNEIKLGNKSNGNNEDGKWKEEVSDFLNGFKEAHERSLTSIEDIGSSAFNSMKKSIGSFKDTALKTLSSFVDEAIETLKEVAEWDLTSSYIYNSSAVDLYTSTGLTGAEAYAFNEALQAEGFSSYNDYIEALPYMNENQLEYMQKIYSIALLNYEESIETSLAYQEFETEYELFKEELEQSVIEFFMENKDTIMTVLEGLIDFLGWILESIDTIVSWFTTESERTESERQSNVADILGVSSSVLNDHSSTSTTNNTTNNSMSLTYNGVSSSDQSWIANTSQMTYQQIIAALKS